MNCFIYIAIAKHSWVIKSGEFKKDQKTLPDKSGNRESLKKYSQQFESFSTNVVIDGEDLLRVFFRLFYLQFCYSGDQSKKHYIAKVWRAIWEIFLHKIMVTIINIELVTNSLLSSFCPFSQTNKRIRFSASWKYFCFLYIANRALLQNHAKLYIYIYIILYVFYIYIDIMYHAVLFLWKNKINYYKSMNFAWKDS